MMLAAIGAITLFATSSPLATPNDYVFAPFPTNSAPVSFIFGGNQWPLEGVRVVRAEDLAFIDEAFKERHAWLLGYGETNSTTYNVMRALKVDDPAHTNLFRFRGLLSLSSSARALPCYCDPDATLGSGTYFTPTGETFMVAQRVYTGRAYTNVVTSVVTNYTTITTNFFRADWPPVLVPAVTNVATTNITLETAVTNYPTPRGYADYVLRMGSGWQVMSNALYGARWAYPAVPSVHDMTNLYALAARCSRAAIPARAVAYPSGYRGTVEVNINYHGYTYDYDKEKWESTALITNIVEQLGNALGPGSSWYSFEAEQFDGGDAPGDTFNRYEELRYNDDAWPVDIDLGAERRMKNVKVFIRFRLSGYQSIGTVYPTEETDFRGVTMFPVKVFNATHLSNSVWRIQGTLGEVEMVLDNIVSQFTKDFKGSDTYNTVSGSCAIEGILVIATPEFKTSTR